LHSDEGVATTQRDKMRVATEFFTKAVGTNSARSRRLNWAALGYSPFNLEDLDMPFTEQELFGTIKSLPSEKAPKAGWVHRYFLQGMLGGYQG